MTKKTIAFMGGVLAGLMGAVQTPSAQDRLPHLRQLHGATQLVVDGEPMLILGGELGNSTASSLETLGPLWPTLQHLNLNTVLAPVYWELVEPDEGQYDFALVDGLLEQARAHEMRLVLLWFGSWKNSMSTYAPGWIKRDATRFPRSRLAGGSALDILTPFSEANASADARAFQSLMQHLSTVDGEDHTVVMVQVENEIGMIPEARDHSEPAESAYAGAVPEELMTWLHAHRNSLNGRLGDRWESGGYATSGTWSEVFGEGIETEELFMAWAFARYVERVAAAGHAAYPLPMYVNAALVRPGRQPGEYPSAGPLPHLVDVWRAGAPTVDFLAPDIYFPNFVEWATAYDLTDNPVFIPEAGRAGASTGVADAFYAIAAHDAIGYSPFSIEDAAEDDAIGPAYYVLGQLAPLLLEHQGTGTIAGMRPPVAFDGTVDEAPQTFLLGQTEFRVSFVDPWTPRDLQKIETHGGLIVALDDETFVVAGTGVTITFSDPGPDPSRIGIDRAEEGFFVDGTWQSGRVLNGDQTHQGRHLRLPPGEVGIQRVRLYRYR